MPVQYPETERPPLRDDRSGYRQRTQEENFRTQEIVISMARSLDRNGGYVLVNELEGRSIFSHEKLAGKTVLEVGCGTLPVTMAIPSEELPRLFIASDVNWNIVNEARRLDDRPHYLVLNALDPAIKEGSVDCIVLSGVLHHLPPDCEFLEHLKLLLSPGGSILVLEPNVSCIPGEIIKWFLRTFLKMSMEASPYGQFSRPKLRKLFDRAGLSVREEWFASMLAFPLTGGLGRCKIVPNSRRLFKVLVWLDETLSKFLNKIPWLAASIHWRVLYRLSPE